MESFEDRRQKFEAQRDEFVQDANERLERSRERGREIARHPIKHARQTLAHQRPDGVIGVWATKAPDEPWTKHELVAAKTLGIVTLANAVSVAGALLTASGINDYHQGSYKKAVAKMGIGRGLDLVDGWVAKHYKTSGVFGAGLDASLDKLLSAYFLYSAIDSGDLSHEQAALHLEQQLEIVSINTKIKRAGGEPNPSKEGKHGQTALWLMAGGIVLSHAFEEGGQTAFATVTDDATKGVEMLSICLNQQAETSYHQQLGELRLAA